MTTFDLNFAADHFTLFGIPRAQGIDAAELETRFRDILAKVHPDKHAHGSDSDQRLSMQWSTRINEAYQTLKLPLSRARYLLHLLGHDAQIESNTAMPMEFLMAQMELREAVAEAKVGAGETGVSQSTALRPSNGPASGRHSASEAETALESLRRQLVVEMKAEYSRLQGLIDIERDYPAATALVRQLMFQEKLLHEIDDALEAVLI